MIIKDTVILSQCEIDPPCKRRQEEEVVQKLMMQCTSCNNRVLLSVSRLAKCPECPAIYDTSKAPMIKKLDVVEAIQVAVTVEEPSIDVI